MSNTAACFWCTRSFEPHRGGSRQTFCQSACRAAFHRATRQWCEQAIAKGRLSVEALRDGLPAAYTLLSGSEALSCQSGIVPPDSVLLEPVARFLVEVSQYTIEMLVRFGWLRGHQQDDLAAITAALRSLGQAPPRVSRIA